MNALSETNCYGVNTETSMKLTTMPINIKAL